MPGRGPVPKATLSRPRASVARDAEMQQVADTGELHGRPLPEGVLPAEQQWHPQTLALWEAIRQLPMMVDETELGWQFLIDTALMHHTMWAKGRWEFASEVRLRLAKFGATPEDRMRLKVKVVKPGDVGTPPAGSDAVTNIASRRSRLTS